MKNEMLIIYLAISMALVGITIIMESLVSKSNLISALIFAVMCLSLGLLISKRVEDWHPIQCILPMVVIAFASFLIISLVNQPVGGQLSLLTVETGVFTSIWGMGWYKLKTKK